MLVQHPAREGDGLWEGMGFARLVDWEIWVGRGKEETLLLDILVQV